ncbi:MAG: hypothetical protein IJS22_09230 [Lachnospiraceae bacterium]|nr:hypothetical protein [Lachnospiraceae bacterium]
MDINYVRELGNSYMVVTGCDGGDGYEQRILNENRVSGLLPQHFSVIDGRAEYYFDISGLQSLERFFAMRQAGYGQFRSVMSSVAELPDKLSEYLISERHVLLTPQTVFVSQDCSEVWFCVCAGLDADFGKGLRDLAAFFMRKADHQDERCVSSVYGLFDLTADEITGRDIRKFLGEDEQKPEEDKILWLDEEDDTEEQIWDNGPRLQPAGPLPGRKEKILKIAGIAAPVTAVIVVGLFLFL